MMLSDLIVARAFLHTDHVDLARAAEIDCAWHAKFRWINRSLVSGGRRVLSWFG